MTTVAPTGETKIVAGSLIADETEATFRWVFERFLDVVKVMPGAILTDSDPAMLQALRAVMPATQRLACLWHLAKNVLENIKPLYARNSEGFGQFMSKWWRVACKSDCASRANFDAEWHDLIGSFTAATKHAPMHARGLGWLQSLYDRRESWAARWTWAVFTAGCDTTQRIESTHAAIKGFLSPRTLLTQLIGKLDEYNEQVASAAFVKNYRLISLQDQADPWPSPAPLMMGATRAITPFAGKILAGQYALAALYRIDEVPGPSQPAAVAPEVFHVTLLAPRSASAPFNDAAVAYVQDGMHTAGEPLHVVERCNNEVLTCTCQFWLHWGVPCRHILQCCVTQQRPLPIVCFAPVWKLRTDDERHAVLQRWRMLRTERVRPVAPSAAAQLSRSERYGLAMSALKPLAEVAAESPSAFTQLQTAAPVWLSQLRSSSTAPGPSDAAALVANPAPSGRGRKGKVSCGAFANAAAATTLPQQAATAAPPMAAAPLLPALPALPAPPQPGATGCTKQRRCPKCGGLGHFAKTCGRAKTVPHGPNLLSVTPDGRDTADGADDAAGGGHPGAGPALGIVPFSPGFHHALNSDDEIIARSGNRVYTTAGSGGASPAGQPGPSSGIQPHSPPAPPPGTFVGNPHHVISRGRPRSKRYRSASEGVGPRKKRK